MEKIESLIMILFILFGRINCLADVKTFQIASRKLGDYQVAINSDKEMTFQELIIHKRGTLVFNDKGVDFHYYFGNFFDDFNEKKDSFSGKDITGNKVPNLVISKWTGGVHCCHYLYIFELGEKFNHLTTIQAQSSTVKIKDLDGDRIPEIQFWDGAIDYEFTSYAQSPKGKVILKFHKDHYDLDTDLMRKNTLSPKELDRYIRPISIEILNHQPTDQLPTRFLDILMTLSYSGKFNEALNFADKAWPKQRKGLEKFKEDFAKSLSHSPYWRNF